MTLAALKKEYQSTILDGMARALWIDAFAAWQENAPTAGGGWGICKHCGAEIEDGWADEEHGGADCPNNDRGHVAKVARGSDLEETTPETPDAAYLAAHDLNKLIAAAEGMKSEKTALADLFELAMQVHLGEWGFDALDVVPDGQRRGPKSTLDNEQLAYEFGFDIAMECLGTGVSWGAHHRVKRAGAVFEPTLPRFEVGYDGESLTWSGRQRGATPSTKAPAADIARHGTQEARYVGEDLAITQNTLGRLIVVNPDEVGQTKHSYVIQIADRFLLVYADDEGDALDEVIDYIDDHEETLGGLLADGIYDERLDEYRQEGMDDDLAFEKASDGLILGGNHGRYVDATEVHITADPSREQLYELAGVAQNPAPSKRSGRKKRNPPVPGDEWGDGGAESAELVMMVRDAIDPKGPLAAYKPEVFSPLSPEGVAERNHWDGRDIEAVPRTVFIRLHPQAAAKAMNAIVYAEWGQKLEGQFLIDHVANLLSNLVAHLDRMWPMPNARWWVMNYGWGYRALIDSHNTDDGQPAESAVVLIGVK